MAGKAARDAADRQREGFLLSEIRLHGATGKFSWMAPFASVACALAFLISAGGCSGRRPIVGSAPTAPISTPPSMEEEAKRSTSTEAQPKPSGAPPKRSRPADNGAPIYTEEGNASWYGEPFHGRKASNGEVYDMNKLTAAHRTLPFDSMVRVTNLSNGKTTTVRITDRGPFVDNRIIDLSRAAAQEIESIGPGIVPVRIEVLSGPDPAAERECGPAERAAKHGLFTYLYPTGCGGGRRVLPRACRPRVRGAGSAAIGRRATGEGRIQADGFAD